MGLRNTIARWFARPEVTTPAAPPSAELTTVLPAVAPGQAPPESGPKGPAPTVAEHAAVAEFRKVIEESQPAAHLVLGSHDTAPPELPHFYTAHAPERPYSDPELLTVHHDYDPAALHDAWNLVSDRADELVRTFYAELFVRLKEAPLMFPSSMARQREDFGRALVQWVLADDPDAMAAHLRQLGADHRKYDVEPKHYETAGAALASAWRKLAGDAWTGRHEAAVLGSYTRLASTMLDGATRNLHEPASWGARVIAHQRILRDFAVLTVQPDEPYPYKPGQYLTLELPEHRRQWRQMSIASAPRADNSFDLHVRAVGGLGVSSALVNHTKVGDRLRLGPPRGNNLVVEQGSLDSGLLCIASGTGAAPISAVVESVLSWRTPPPGLDVFIGGRTRADVYSVDTLNDLIRARGRSQIARAHGVVDDPAWAGYRGRIESVVPSLHDWAALGVDVLIAGPNAMIESTVAALREAQVPRAKIRFDQYELVG